MERAGSQKIVLVLAGYLAKMGCDVTLCFFYDKSGTLPELEGRVPFRIVNLNAKRPGARCVSGVWHALRANLQLYSLLCKLQIDTIITFTHYSNILGVIWAYLARVPVRIASQRNTLSEFPLWFLKLDALIANSLLVDKMISVSEHTSQFCINVEGIHPNKIVTIPNGLNTDNFAHLPLPDDAVMRLKQQIGISPTAMVVMTVARLHPQKGHRYLILAAPLILEACPDTVFVFVGEGELRVELEDRIRSQNIDAHFRLIGARADVADLLGMADLFVLPSISEGMPNVLLEAMAARLPIVATSVDGTVEIVETDSTGILVENRNSQALAAAVSKLLQDQSLRHAMGAAGFQRVRELFSEDEMCRRYWDVITALHRTKGLLRSQK